MTATIVVPGIGLNLGDMISRVRWTIDAQQLDAVGNRVDDDMWRDEEIIEWINEGYDYYRQIVIQNYEAEFEKVLVRDFVANQVAYDLPNDYLKTTSIERNSQNAWIPLPYEQSPTAPLETIDGSLLQTSLPSYRFQGMQIIFNPPSNQTESGAWRLRYYSLSPSLLEEGDVPAREFNPLWHRLLIVYAAIIAIEKDKGDTLDYRVRQGKLEQAFINFLEMRSLNPWFVSAFQDDVRSPFGQY